jgi:hypothetical protein
LCRRLQVPPLRGTPLRGSRGRDLGRGEGSDAFAYDVSGVDLGGGMSPSEAWRRGKEQATAARESAFSPPTTQQKPRSIGGGGGGPGSARAGGLGPLPSSLRGSPDTVPGSLLGMGGVLDRSGPGQGQGQSQSHIIPVFPITSMRDGDDSDSDSDGGLAGGLTRHGKVLPSFEATTLPPEKRTTNTPTKSLRTTPTKAEKILSAKSSRRNILVRSREDDGDGDGDREADDDDNDAYATGGNFGMQPFSVGGLERNAAMVVGLQRQKALSSAQNEQLQKEVRPSCACALRHRAYLF